MFIPCFIILAPRILPVLWNVAKPFLHEETRKKIVICKGEYDFTVYIIKVVVKTKYFQRFSPQNYAWLINYIKRPTQIREA